MKPTNPIPEFSFYNFLSLESTNKTAKKYPPYSVITATEQTDGKGRRKRRWQSPPGGLYASIVLPAPPIDKIGMLSIISALSLSESIPIQNKIKWPNDILIKGKKVSGILIETTTQGDFIIGIGVNLTCFPKMNINYPATSLAAEGYNIFANDLLTAFLCLLKNNLALPDAEVITLWKQKVIGIKKQITVTLANKHLSGVFKGIDAKGNLILSDIEGKKQDKIVTYGEVFFNKEFETEMEQQST